MPAVVSRRRPWLAATLTSHAHFHSQIRKLDPRTTIFSVNFNRFGVVAFGGRSTAVSLKAAQSKYI